ncbi:MAG: hypothetical protein WBN03_11355 [Desulfobacterales bacterium]
MVEKINTGSKWAWVLSPTGVQKAEQRRSKKRQRNFRRNLEDRYSGEGREESENSPPPGEITGASESRAVDEAPSHGRLKKRGKLIDIHA